MHQCYMCVALAGVELQHGEVVPASVCLQEATRVVQANVVVNEIQMLQDWEVLRVPCQLIHADACQAAAADIQMLQLHQTRGAPA